MAVSPAPRCSLLRTTLRFTVAVAVVALHSVAVAQPPATTPRPTPTRDQPKLLEKQRQGNSPRYRRVPIFDGRTLKQWKVLDKIDFEKHGKVQVRNGEIHLGKGRPATGLAFTGKPPRIDYELSMEAKRIEGDDFFCGRTFPYGKDYVTLICGGWGGKTTGLSNVDGDAAIENETASFIDFEQNRWYRIRLRVTEPRIEAWIDNEKIVDLETEGHKFSIWWEQEPVRPLGFATWYSAAVYRKIQLKRLAATDKQPAKKPASSKEAK